MEINYKIIKIISVVFVFLLLWLAYTKFVVPETSSILTSSSARRLLSDFSKEVAIAYTDGGNYGQANLKLPHSGCTLPGTLLDLLSPKIKSLSPDDVFCLVDGDGGFVRTWVVSIKLENGEYWCQDESGNRKTVTTLPTSTSCN